MGSRKNKSKINDTESTIDAARKDPVDGMKNDGRDNDKLRRYNEDKKDDLGHACGVCGRKGLDLTGGALLKHGGEDGRDEFVLECRGCWDNLTNGTDTQRTEYIDSVRETLVKKSLSVALNGLASVKEIMPLDQPYTDSSYRVWRYRCNYHRMTFNEMMGTVSKNQEKINYRSITNRNTCKCDFCGKKMRSNPIMHEPCPFQPEENALFCSLKCARDHEIEEHSTDQKIYRHACHCCGAVSESMSRCIKCRCSFYCGTECQKKAWKGHREECSRITATKKKLAAVTVSRTGSDVVVE